MAKKKTGAVPETQDVQEAETNSVFVTYLPDDGDNDLTTVHGVTFQADDPLELNATDPRHSAVLARVQGNPFFYVGDDPPPSKKSVAVRERAAGVLDRLEDLIFYFRDGKATHYHADELAKIAQEIKESKR